MALYGVIGDIHGNKEALLAVLAFLDAHRVGRLVCVGDIVGFNADSNECIGILQERRALAVAGNHDRISTCELSTAACSDKAAYALERTRTTLTPGSIAFLRDLPHMLLIEGQRVALVHAGVRDVQLYMRTPTHIRHNAALLRDAAPQTRLCFFGHTHDPRIFRVQGEIVSEIPADGCVRLDTDALHFINPGSVDAARKPDGAHAECAIFDARHHTVHFHSVRYDAAYAEAKAADAGYRLSHEQAQRYRWRRRLWRRLRQLPNYLRVMSAAK